jgi:hypothetical protein
MKMTAEHPQWPLGSAQALSHIEGWQSGWHAHEYPQKINRIQFNNYVEVKEILNNFKIA